MTIPAGSDQGQINAGLARRYDILSANIREGVFIISSDGKISAFNSAFESITGWQISDGLNKTLEDLVHQEDFPLLWENLRIVLAESKYFLPQKIRFLTKSGGFVLVDLKILLINQQNMGDSMLGIIYPNQDDSPDYPGNSSVEKRTAQIQAAKMIAVGRLSRGVAHELNNPLTIILNSAELMKLLMNKMPEEYKQEFSEPMEYMHLAIKRCQKIIKSLSDFSQCSSGKFTPIEIHDLLERVLLLIEYDTRSDNIEVERKFSLQLPQLNGDSHLLEQVFFNIFINARWAILQKFNKANGGKISVETSYEPGSNCIKIIIRDNGIGIPQENISKMFEAFFTTKPPGEGVGVGLYLSYNIIKEHKGNITVKSQIIDGTIFEISLPLI
jgi:PAS domain S-box-containing protein